MKIPRVLQDPDLRKKIFWVLAILAVFRLAASIPVPGVNPDALRAFFAQNQFFNLLNLFSGGGLENLSIVMLGVGPYITASIIMQLFTIIFPKLKEMHEESGEQGRAKFNQYTRYLTVPLAFLQAFGLIKLLSRQGVFGETTTFSFITNLVVVVAGTLFLMWLGEIISEYKIGNGISLLIFAGIVARLPREILNLALSFNVSQLPYIIGFVLIGLLVIAAVVFVTEGERDIPVSYAKRVRGTRMYGGISTHLPLRVNQAGVIPIIFALSIILLPGMIATFLSAAKFETLAKIASSLANLFNRQSFYGGLYFILVVVFTYFYTAIAFDPKKISENIQKQGGFIPGIRPGSHTVDYLYKIVNRITLVGAIFLGLIAILPFIVQTFTKISTITIGGTSLLIVVSVVLETIKQIEAQMVMREYDTV
ncbi:MAG: preprotein translocase subunit SecY [Parcubacteria group bacterium]|nr:preprotein translocase subunit SecY [Parcubacteria group bacterium]